MKKTLKLTGQSGVTYDLDEISGTGTRLNSDEELIVQVWEWNPEFQGDHSKPNPPNLEIGQIWLSKLTPVEILEEKYN